ncbi:uncharacterized protein LOC132756707 isoform X2 [Ruditapes philippinarum]|uniref:uncharacterized protein LOC132756707 isoform X2 n=1 Tax=Ruditapes philippinarum TaxID=129788 RepID=UPI00295C0FEB|nr:uncharacterized protein LOC132756707 isoform X2 [Ruditapes philippinarum]
MITDPVVFGRRDRNDTGSILDAIMTGGSNVTSPPSMTNFTFQAMTNFTTQAMTNFTTQAMTNFTTRAETGRVTGDTFPKKWDRGFRFEDRGTGMVDRGTGKIDRGTGMVDRGTGMVDRGTGKIDRGTGMVDRGTGKIDRGTGIVDRGTGKIDRGTGMVDRAMGTGPVGFGRRDRNVLSPGLASIEQRRLNRLCAEKCKTEHCYLADELDCRNFINCQQDTRSSYHATLQPCAFGTYWAGLQLQQKITCDVPTEVVCNRDYCGGLASGAKYDNPDGNCKTYWDCGIDGKPKPRCCKDGFRFDNKRNECVQDLLGRCHDKCPIKKDACVGKGNQTEFFDDGNCVTFWDCEDFTPHPVCCPEGQGYDAVRGCINNPLCKDICPDQYKPDICLRPNVEKYSLLDGSCRTYMRCNAVEGDERWCCPSNFVFDGNTQSCIEKTPDMNLKCSDLCPPGFKEVCPLRPAFNESDHFLTISHGIETKMPCAPGTEFTLHACGCSLPVENPPDNSCALELDILFDAPTWHRLGSQSAVKIESIGTIGEGPKLNGRTSYKFNGDLYFRTPFFQSSYENLFIKLVYLPEADGTIGNYKQILLSNCMRVDLGAPSLELYLQNNELILELATDGTHQNAPGLAVGKVQYTPGMWNTLTVIYNGHDVYMLNEGTGLPTFDRKPLTGAISVAAEGLDFGGCYTHRNRAEGYMGSLAELQFSKCLHQKWIDTFNANLPDQP